MGVMIIKTHTLNPRYIKPRYGRGFFGSFSRVLSGGLKRVKNSSILKKGLHNAISVAKKTAVKTGKAAKQSLKNGALRDIAKAGLDVAGTLASEHLNKTIESAASKVQTQMDKKIPTNSPLRNIADGIVQGSAEIGKTLAHNALSKAKNGIINKVTSNGGSQKKSIVIKRNKTSTKVRKQQTPRRKTTSKKKKKKVDWGDMNLNSLIASQ